MRAQHCERAVSSYRPSSVRTKLFTSHSATYTLAGGLALAGTPISFGRDDEVYREGEPARYLYKVISGAVRTCKLLGNGRRQIAAFHLPGDVFGLTLRPEYSLSAEGIGTGTLLVFKRDDLTEIAERDNDAARELWFLTAIHLQQVQEHMLLLVKSAQERVAAFLLEMATRTPSGNAVDLPMSRQDIADYLGLTIETVSRTLTLLESRAAINLPTSRRIVLRDRSLLSQLNFGESRAV